MAAGGRGVSVSQNHMEPEVWWAWIDYTPAIHAELWDDEHKKPRKRWAYLYDDTIAGALQYPPLELFSVEGDEEGLHIGGLGILNALGTGGIGPMIVDREYVSGADKLSNGDFALGGLYWRRISEDSMWLFAGGLATNAGGRRTDDVLEFDRKFPTRPGHQYTAQMDGVSGTGRLRLRTIYEGRFNPADLLYAGGFEELDGWTTTANITLVTGGQRSGARSMRIGPIPKPQLLTYWNFPGTGWSADDQLSVAGGVLTCAPIPYPDLFTDGGLEVGTGWTLPANGDIAIETTAEARTGAKAMRVGPITQLQLLKNPHFDSTAPASLAGSSDAPPTQVRQENAEPLAEPAEVADLLHHVRTAPMPVGLSEGARGRDVAAVQAYLARYGYLQPNVQVLSSTPDDAEFDLATKEALKDYQRFYKLRPTGTLTQRTLDLMKMPRCGVPDKRPDDGRRGFAVLPEGAFGHRHISYRLFSHVADLSESSVLSALEVAFSKWAAVVGVDLTFTRVTSGTDIGFRSEPSDPGGALAVAITFEDRSVTIKFFDDYTWQVGTVDPGNYDFTRVAIHEIGHALGLDHSSVTTAVMFASTSDGLQSHELDPDDVAGIQFLYPDEPPADIPYWFMSSEDAEPDPGLFYIHPTDGVEDGPGATTDGASPAGRIVRYLRADYVDGGGVDEHPVTPGEQYELEVWVRRAASDGYAYASIAIPHPTVADRQRWHETEKVDDRQADDVDKLLTKQVNIPAGRSEINILLEVHDHTTGYWTFSEPRVTRTRGNRQRAEVTTPIAVVANNAYRLSARMRSHDEFQVGSVRLGVKLTGTGLDDDVTDVSQGHTDSVWTLVKVEFTPQDGYDGAEPFILGEDIIGDPMWVDDFRLEKISNNTRQTNHPAVPIVAGQRYQLASSVRSLAGQTRGEVRVGVVLSGPGVDDTDVAVDQSDTEGKVLRLTQDFTPDDGYDTAVAYVRFKDVEGAPFEVYGVELTKMDNNADSSSGFAVAVIPERTYRWLQAVRSGVNLQRGTVKLSVVCSRAGMENVTFDSQAMEATNGEWKFIDFSFTPPSGYASLIPKIIGTDVEGDVWNVDEGEIRDTDTSTHVSDSWLTSPANGTTSMLTVAPEGAESVRVALVAESETSDWSVDTVSLVRSGVAPSTAAAIVADTLIHPDTGNALPIVAGTITAPAVIPYDFVVQNQTNRQLLDHLCSVVADPPLEYRVKPTDPPAIDVGPADVVCTTHPMADALLPEDNDVEELSNPTTDTSERPTEVTVLGAELETVSGQPFLITATAQVPGPTEYDLNENVVVRTKPHHDATVDHVGYAEALAADLAEREAAPALAVNVKLSGKDTRADMPPGDTVWAYEPESGLSDPDNSGVIIEGNTVFPRSCRVLARERVHGPSHRIVMRRPDGTEFALTGVRWSDEDALVLTIGDRLPSWQADPQGHAEGLQYLRDRASRPR